MDTNTTAIADKLRDISRSISELAALIDGNIPGDRDLVTRQIAVMREFDVKPSQGLSRVQASAAFKKHGLDPRSFGSWVQGGYMAREGERRWLTDYGRDWIESKINAVAA
jgi:hypothetical protein